MSSLNAMQDENLLLQLHKWASRQDENFLTDAFAHLLRHLRDHEPHVATGLLSLLTGNRLQVSEESVSKVAITTQVTTEQGRPDLEIQSRDHLVFVEVKNESAPSEGQLSRYRKDLEDRGIPNTTLVLLTRYPVDLPSDAADVFCRWHEVGAWLQNELGKNILGDAVSVFLVKQFVEFLKLRSITMDKVGWELASGVKALCSLLAMLEEAIDAQDLKGSYCSAWDYLGYNFDDKNFYLGINYVDPSVVVFQTCKFPVRKDAAESVGIGRVEPNRDSPSGIMWTNGLDLESEEVHFFALSCEKQRQCIEEFLGDCLTTAQKIKGK